MIKPFLRHLIRARDEHALHSPFLFDLYTTVIRQDRPDDPLFGPVQSLRRRMLADKRLIQITDFGAGSRVNAAWKRPIRDIARNSLKAERFGRLLYRLIRKFNALTVLDLGTSLGITTLYEAIATPGGRVITFEGCPETAAVAQKNFEQAGVGNIELVVGNLDETLPACVAALDRLDFVFFDANHRCEPTVRYFETCLPKMHNDTCFVFDDIHWSDDMERAWESIKAHPDVTVTVDLFYIGLVFFRREQPKQHFVLRF